ncbi:MAG TPA: hypothetical protein DIS76_02035 [Rhodospirillaceae bacterium]|nr:hypothetical protein [Rhodospirillaceae bacterium]
MMVQNTSPAMNAPPTVLPAWVAIALAATGDVVYELDLNQGTITWHGEIEKLFGPGMTTVTQMKPRRFYQMIHSNDLSLRINAIESHMSSRTAYDCEYRIRRHDGLFVWVHDRGMAECDAAGQPTVLRGVIRSIHQRKQTEAQLTHRASFDELTGHFNRQRLRDRLQDSLKQAQRYGHFGAFLVIGLDKLSLINEAYGHDAADTVIVRLGQLLEAQTRVSDSIGRIGGDLYGVVLPRCSPDKMGVVADKILRACRDAAVETNAGRLQVSVSIGGVTFPGMSQSAFDIMTKAESALHQAKGRGRDCFIEYHQSDEQMEAHRSHMEIGHSVVEAIKEGRAMFAYQPVVDSQTAKPMFYEALLRLRSPSGELIPAGKFIPAVEHVGLARLVDRHVLEMAVEDLMANPELSIAMNISGLTVAEHSWLRALIGKLQDKPDVARRLIVEITETEALRDIDESARFVQAVRDLGCKVALDDFGAGYTSFKHLKALEVDIVKIDGGYVRGIHENRDNRVFVHSLIELARTFGLQIIAECIEEEAEANHFREEGVQFMQGYFFGKPEVGVPKI